MTTARFSPLTGRIAGRGADAWDTHFQAVAAAGRGEDVIVLSVGDPDFDTPAVIVAAAVEALRRGDTHYAEIPGRLPLRQAVADHQRRLFGAAAAAPSAENVIITAGAQNALFMAAQCLLTEGDEVIVLEPAYVTYPATVEATGAVARYVPLCPGGGFRLDAGALAGAITSKTKAILFSNPNNPTGMVMGADELSAILDLAARHDLWVISDEVYSDLVFGRPFLPMATLPGAAERVVTIGSLSKSHAMTGWRCGWMIGPAALIAHAERLALAMLYGLPGFVQAAGLAALTQAAEVPAAMTAAYLRRRDLAWTILRDCPRVAPLLPEAGMFMMLDVTDSGLAATDFCHRLYRETGVSVLDGAAFGGPSASFIRLSFATADDALAEGCRRLRRFVESLPPA